MARTRSSLAQRESGEGGDTQETAPAATKTSFNGALQQFGFTSTSMATGSLVDGVTAQITKKRRVQQTERSGSASPSKKQKRSSKYAPPSKYAHLKGIPDAIAPNMLCLLVGHNPGVQTATFGHACEFRPERIEPNFTADARL
jgi:hypothetical protein